MPLCADVCIIYLLSLLLSSLDWTVHEHDWRDFLRDSSCWMFAGKAELWLADLLWFGVFVVCRWMSMCENATCVCMWEMLIWNRSCSLFPIYLFELKSQFTNTEKCGRFEMLAVLVLSFAPCFMSFPYPPSPPGPSYSSYRLPPVVMSPVVSMQHSEGAPTLSQRGKKRKENSDNS